jgi:hypothetical protein
MRRGPRSHNSRVDSERRGEGRTSNRRPFPFPLPLVTAQLGARFGNGFFQWVRIGVGIAFFFTVQALEIFFN